MSAPSRRLVGPLLVAALALVALALAARPAPAAASRAACQPDTAQPNGSIYRFCLPPGWSAGGGLLVYAHGYVWFNEPLAIPEDHLCFGDPPTCVNELVNDLGLAFATTSYPTNGLAVLPAVDDVVRLVDVFSTTYGSPGTVLIGGVSEGGLVTALAVERHPEHFDGGLAACGPLGSWVGQIGYFGDFRVLFDYFFPGLIPTEQIAIPAWLIEAWGDGYFETTIAPVIFDPANGDRLAQLLATSGAPFVPGAAETIRLAVRDGLAYNVMATNEVIAKLGGNPFDNTAHTYSGSHDDAALNAGVRRFAADPAALVAMTAYETSGHLTRPLVTLHTTRDQQVPHWHELRYRAKVLLQRAGPWHVDQPMPVDRYGHCQFDVSSELLPAFFTLLGMVADPPSPTTLYLPTVQGRAPAYPGRAGG